MQQPIEQAKKRDKKILITDAAIGKVGKVKIAGFDEIQNTMLQVAHQELLKHAKEYNKSDEVLKITDIHFKRIVSIIGDENHVDPNTSIEARVLISDSGRQELIFMHNHPSTNTFSVEDIKTFVVQAQIKAMTVVTNQGVVYALSKNEQYDYNNISNILKELVGKKLYGKAFVKEFIKKCKNGGVDYASSKK